MSACEESLLCLIATAMWGALWPIWAGWHCPLCRWQRVRQLRPSGGSQRLQCSRCSFTWWRGADDPFDPRILNYCLDACTCVVCGTRVNLREVGGQNPA